MDEPSLSKLAVVIDDDLSVAETTTNALTLAGVRAVGISNGVKPEHIFFDPPVDVLLCDIMLAGDRTGVELCRDLRAAGWRCPMIAFSASDQMEQLAHESDLFYATLGKPFDVTELVGVVQKALAEEP